MRGITLQERPEEVGDPYRSGARRPTTLTLRYRWSADVRGTLLVVAFTAFWDACVVVFLRGGRLPWFLWFHVAVAVVFSYGTLATLLNRTIIEASSGYISARVGPLPWLRSVRTATSDVQTITCERIERQARRGRRVHYALAATLKGGEQVRLCEAFSDAAEPEYIADKLREWLDRRVELQSASSDLLRSRSTPARSRTR